LFRSHRKWRKLLPTLGEVVGLDVEEVGGALTRHVTDGQTFILGLPPIEARIRLPATDLMYEVCRVQKLSPSELAQFDDRFIDHLFELVETTRDNQDERLNYAVIRLIVRAMGRHGADGRYRSMSSLWFLRYPINRSTLL
jgi:hypothetical protein